MASGVGGSSHSVEFQRERVALLGLVGGGIGLGFWLFRFVGAAGQGILSYVLEPSMTYHALGAASLLGIWVGARWARTARAVGWLEVGGLLLSSVAYQLMGAHIELVNLRPDLTATLALSYGLITRAVFVPSGTLRTVAITSTVGVLHLVILYASGRPREIFEAAGVAAMPAPVPLDAAAFTVAALAENFGWWAATAVLCGAISQVLYGLRQEVRAARRLGQYALEEKIGEGGMGVVYRARHTLLRRPTAVKLLPPERSGEQAIARFEREVRLASQLTHPNTVTIFDYGRTPTGVFYYAMELLDGADLLEIVRVDGPQPAARVVRVLDQVCGSLAEAHATGLIHRDVKPANVILCERGGVPDVAKVVDFGLARPLDEAAVRLTASTTLTGTPLYMPPESISDPEQVDERSDLYSLGAVAYFLLAGEDVFTGRNAVEVCGHHLHTEPEPLARRTGGRVPPVLDRIVLDCLAKRPGDRPRSALDLRERLRDSGLQAWGEWEAREWWDEHGEELRRRRAATAPSDLTLAVDLEARGAPSTDSTAVTRER